MRLLEPIEKAIPDLALRQAFDGSVARSFAEAGLQAVETEHSPTVRRLLQQSWALIARDHADPDKVAGHLRKLERQLTVILSDAAGQGVRQLNERPTLFRVKFRLSAPEAAGWAATRAGDLVATIGADVRQVVRQHVTAAVLDGMGPGPLAMRLARFIGLTPRDAKAVAALEAASLKGGMPKGQASASANAYAARLKDVRANTIARTELLTASNFGQSASWRQAVKANQLPSSVRRRWLTASSETACELCAPMHGVMASVDGAFRANGKAVYHPPLHPSCRCTLGLWHPSMES